MTKPIGIQPRGRIHHTFKQDYRLPLFNQMRRIVGPIVDEFIG
jgi:hypothetical protein